MKHKMLALILSLLLMAGFGHQVEAGFQDWLKDVAGKIGGEKALSDEDIVDGEFKLYQAAGCDQCLGTGYLGRTGIYEMVMITDEIRNNILRNADSNTIKRVAREDGMISLRDDGARKVLAGMTTIEEVLRVTHEDAG